ncbi:hypothetical protein K443DRAFT_327188 [Laccaria amethystina LaAM-08-1]|uniref:Uncharacterized protein n=1 Tax=Laccaria amethystina LaAM-08-1 TaxID=1095629 RepID=A0A0C9XL79_9AGAR|nr:hypothetical protein K443DRAFT_327188 [Laccaria amethystina LaAM-08-1]
MTHLTRGLRPLDLQGGKLALITAHLMESNDQQNVSRSVCRGRGQEEDQACGKGVAERESRTLAGRGGGPKAKKEIVMWSIFVTNWVAEQLQMLLQ